VCIRPISPEDRERIVEGLHEMSAETSYRRFFTPRFYPSDRALDYLTQIDGEQHMALGAVDCSRDGDPGVGAARYVRLPEAPTVAEAAVVVIDAYQRQGIGSMLLACLSRYAADHGVEWFRGFVLAENQEFLRFLRTLGGVNEQVHEGVIQLDVPVYVRADNLPEQPGTGRARRAWRMIDEAEIADCDGPVD
jgi:GNAT superfamily N-acetyltransferase